MQRQQIIILVQGAITIAALAFAAGVYRETRHTESFSLEHLQDSSRMVQTLNLDPPQAQQLEMLNAGLRKQLQGTCQRNCEARRKLAAAIEEGSETDHETILKEMCEAYEASERATLAHLQAVRAILDSEQRATFDELVSRCLCGGCGEDCTE